MQVQDTDLPVTLQAFDLKENKEVFVAEQVVNNQDDVDLFTSQYAGKVIKASKTPYILTEQFGNRPARERNALSGLVMIVVVIAIIGLIIYGFSTGWIQRQLHWNI